LFEAREWNMLLPQTWRSTGWGDEDDTMEQLHPMASHQFYVLYVEYTSRELGLELTSGLWGGDFEG
jgi:hypothetical protein